MSNRIAPTRPASAPEETKPLLAELKGRFGSVPNLFATIGQSPAALKGLLDWQAALAKGVLSPRERELVNLHVSEYNGCAYCVSAHAVLGKMAGLSPTEIAEGRRGRAASNREEAILGLVRRVMRTGGGGAGTELVAAREAGLSDAAIIEVLAQVAEKTFTNAVGILAQTEIDFPEPARLPQT